MIIYSFFLGGGGGVWQYILLVLYDCKRKKHLQHVTHSSGKHRHCELICLLWPLLYCGSGIEGHARIGLPKTCDFCYVESHLKWFVFLWGCWTPAFTTFILQFTLLHIISLFKSFLGQLNVRLLMLSSMLENILFLQVEVHSKMWFWVHTDYLSKSMHDILIGYAGALYLSFIIPKIDL